MRSRFTSSSLNAWRVNHGLFVRDMAWLFGWPLGTLKHKLYGGGPIGLDADRQTENIDLLLRAGIQPAGWPLRLRDAVHVNKLPC
jgi:hypothetical protein